MSHRPPTGSTTVALAAVLLAALALGGCSSDPQEPAPGDAGATSVSTSAARVPTAAPRESPPPARTSSPATDSPVPSEWGSPSPVPPFIEAAT
ncbi:MAG: hypothetical protein H5T80_14180, partial [Dietzia sp.]|nr:hypothetical protein [Dietzia sp.]